MLNAVEVKSRILELLKSYPSMQQKIALLRREWENPAQVTDSEMLGAMVYSKGESGSRPTIGHISDKTYHIAVNYHGRLPIKTKSRYPRLHPNWSVWRKKHTAWNTAFLNSQRNSAWYSVGFTLRTWSKRHLSQN